MIKIPYGISNFETLVNRGQYYVDRTPYIEQLEEFFSSYLFFVRPRRFGKSLFISLLEYYYGIQYKEKFDKLFGQYYIGQNPTPLANQYLILKFDFSRIDTSSFENTLHSFLGNAKDGGINFFGDYPQFFDEKDIEELKGFTYPSHVMQHILSLARRKASNHKIYLLIDEYDHFANEILSSRFDDFHEMVSKYGFVRKFYEAIKVGTHGGVIDRLFVTGVSPITLDSLTSGFNISKNISFYEEFNDMMGFREEEVKEILEGIEVPDAEIEPMLVLMKRWYDGYVFAEGVVNHLYNSDMVLYFASEYSRKKQYPKELLDLNIASDYMKVRRIFKIKGNQEEHLKHLEKLLRVGQIRSPLVRQFEISKRFDRQDFISLLYYMGIITIKGSQLADFIFRMPNYVMQELYYKYFHDIIVERSQLKIGGSNVNEKLYALALENDVQPMIRYMESLLTELSNRDKMNFDEKYLKIIFTSAFFTASIYTIRNEVEVKKSATEKGYIDLLLVKRPPYETKFQFVFELKYLKKATAKKAEKTKQEAVSQLKKYLQNDEYLQQMKALKAYAVVFVGNKGFVEEVEV